jgi:exodeoxyribonuclease-3
MKIIAWNVNGIRSLIKSNHLQQIIDEKPDVLCIGETKIDSNAVKNIDNNEILSYFKYRYWYSCMTKKGYSGTAVFSIHEPLNVFYGIVNSNIDNEGRVITLEFEKFYLVHVYTPNSGEDLKRLEWRTTVWDREFEKHIINLQKTKPVIVCGDLNVAHNEIDLAKPKTNTKTAGFTMDERKSFSELLNNTKLIDIYRKLYPEKIQYTYWSYMRQSREKNIGWRIDYFLLDEKLSHQEINTSILSFFGSDHTAIELII